MADEQERYIEIPVGRERKWFGLVAWWLLLLGVAGLLILLFRKFTSNLWLAVILVAFLLSYMLVMGWWASRHLEGRDR